MWVRRATATAVGVLLLGGCAAKPTTLATINAPIVLNDTPFIGDSSAMSRSPAGGYSGTNRHENAGNFVTDTHTAQLAAAAAIGGQRDRAIVRVRYEITDLYAFLYAFVGVDVRGEIIEYAPPPEAP